MRVTARLHPLFLLLSLLLALGLSAVAQDSATSQIKAEIARLEQSIKDQPVTDKDFAPIATMGEGALNCGAGSIPPAL